MSYIYISVLYLYLCVIGNNYLPQITIILFFSIDENYLKVSLSIFKCYLEFWWAGLHVYLRLFPRSILQ